MHVLRKFIWLLCLLPLLHVQCSNECQSKFYCRTDEFKYASMERIQNAYMNATPISTYNVSSIPDCQKYCIRAEKCRSVNIKYNESNVQVCQLLNVNMFSNTSLLVKNENYTHLYIPSPCSKNPCLNGGTCVPLYTNDSYKCEYKSGTLTYSKGINCEKAYTGYASAFLYWSFDDYGNKIPNTSSNLDVSPFRPGIKRTGYESGRKSPVAVCIRAVDDGACMEFWANIPCVNTFSTCSTGVSYSIWMKLAKSEFLRSRNSYIFSTYAFGSSRGLELYAKQVRTAGFAFKISIAANSRWELSGFGQNIEMINWNHIVLTVEENTGVCAYVNGKKDICGGTKTAMNLPSEGRCVRLAGHWYAGAAMDCFFDDFAIWRSVLSEKEVENLYMASKA